MKKPEVLTIEVKNRDLGWANAEHLRANHLIPAVIYGPKMESNHHVAAPEADIEKLLSYKNITMLKLKLENGEEIDALLKRSEFDPITDGIDHIDFYALDADTPVKVTVPLRLTGTPKGVTEGGRMYQPLRRLNIKAKPDMLPAEVSIQITELAIGDTLKVAAIDPEGIEILDSPDRTVCVIRPPRTGITAETPELEEEEDEDADAEAAEGEEGEAAEGEETAEEKADA